MEAFSNELEVKELRVLEEYIGEGICCIALNEWHEHEMDIRVTTY
jgi:hypothetical protein